MPGTETHAPQARTADDWPRQYLGFRLCGLEYGVAIEKVRGLHPLKALEPFAGEGEMVKAVGISRGLNMPLVDMRVASGCGSACAPADTDVIVLQLAGGMTGMMVDGVTDIVALTRAAITPVPGTPEPFDYLLGRGEVDGRRLILIDIDKLMSIRRAGARLMPPGLRAAPAIPAILPPAAPDPS
jgi:purine-binding chemotaxis protein CheW